MVASIPDDYIEIESYSIRGEGLATFYLQPAFVEGIIPEPKKITSIVDAFRFIFRNNRKFGIISWNGIPIRFSYTEDLPLMIEPLLDLLTELKDDSMNKKTTIIHTPNLQLTWQLEKRSPNTLLIEQVCSFISGKYESSLNNLGMIFINCDRFMNEWKLLLAQLIEAFSRSEVVLDSIKALQQMEQLIKLTNTIKDKGWLYK